MKSAPRLSRLLGAALLIATAAVGAVQGAPGPSGNAAPAETPSLRLPGLDGEMHELDDWRGRVLVLNFWASWCAPCQHEIPDLVEWQRRYGDAGLQVIGVGIDEARKLRNVGRTLEINYPIWVLNPTAGGAVLAAWGNPVGMVPYTVVLDRLGRVIHRHKGVLDSALLQTHVLPLLDLK